MMKIDWFQGLLKFINLSVRRELESTLGTTTGAQVYLSQCYAQTAYLHSLHYIIGPKLT